MDVKVMFKLMWLCPKCGGQHGLRCLPEQEDKYINGPCEEEVVCRKCKTSYILRSVRKFEKGV